LIDGQSGEGGGNSTPARRSAFDRVGGLQRASYANVRDAVIDGCVAPIAAGVCP